MAAVTSVKTKNINEDTKSSFQYLDDAFYQNIKDTIEKSRQIIYSSVRSESLHAFWLIGNMIVEKQKGEPRAEYGDGLIKELSIQMTKDFGPGFSERSLRRMRQFYLVFPIWPTVWTELSWSHYKLLINVKKEDARIFYIQEAIDKCWSVRQLARQIHTCSFERYQLSGQNYQIVKETTDAAKEEKDEIIVKDPMILDFLGLKPGPQIRETDLEQALIDHMQEFLLNELNGEYAFVARQKRFQLEDQSFFVDLVFYNIRHKCYFLIDLKTKELTHQDIGQMMMYVNYYTREINQKDDNPAIGLILCATKNDLVVRYTLPEGTTNIKAAQYLLELPKEKEEILRKELTKTIEKLEHREK